MKYSLYLCSESWVGNDSMNMHEAPCYMQVTCLTRVTARAAAPCFPPSLLSASLRNKEVSWKRRRRGISRELLFFPASMKHLHTNEADTHPKKQKNLRARTHARTHRQTRDGASVHPKPPAHGGRCTWLNCMQTHFLSRVYRFEANGSCFSLCFFFY